MRYLADTNILLRTIPYLLTFNSDDFKRFKGIIMVIEPQEVIQQPSNP